MILLRYYRPGEWGKFILHWNHAYHNFGGFFHQEADYEEKYDTLSPTFEYFFTTGTFAIFQCDLAKWQQKDTEQEQTEYLKFAGVVAGLRSTL